MKILWIDSETGGLVPDKNPILTLAGIIEIDGEVKEEFYFKVKPFANQVIDDYALQVNGITREEIETFEEPNVVKNKLNKIFSKYIDKYNKKDKFIPAGQNVRFDIDHLQALYKRCGDTYLFSWLDYHYFDTMAISLLLKKMKHIEVENVKLETMCAYYQIPIKAHNAQEDIRATRNLWNQFEQHLRYEK